MRLQGARADEIVSRVPRRPTRREEGIGSEKIEFPVQRRIEDRPIEFREDARISREVWRGWRGGGLGEADGAVGAWGSGNVGKIERGRDPADAGGARRNGKDPVPGGHPAPRRGCVAALERQREDECGGKE